MKDRECVNDLLDKLKNEIDWIKKIIIKNNSNDSCNKVMIVLFEEEYTIFVDDNKFTYTAMWED